MHQCRSCSEPATLLCHLSRPGSTAEDYYCYIHAVEAGLIEIPIEELRPLAIQAGYSVNAVTFVIEAINASECLTNARDVCFAVLKAARKQFGASSSEAFRFWNMNDITDIGRIVVALVNTEYAPKVKHVDQKDFGRPLTLLEILELV
jgi:uncharacterized repeat protein (TIGR04138 family)